MTNKDLGDRFVESAYLGADDGYLLKNEALTLGKTFPESTNQKQTQTLTIPKLKLVKSITVNTGNVTYTVSGDTITLNLSNGAVSRQVQTGGSAGGSKSISNYGNGGTWTIHVFNTCPNSDNRGPSTISYSDGQGYTGTLSIYEAYHDLIDNVSCDGKNYGSKYIYHYAYQGTVTKPDTRTWQNYYQYTVTVDYVNNSAPELALSTPPNNQTLSQGTPFQLKGSASDTDNGNVLTVKYKINSGSTKALQSGISNGSTPISFDRTLTYRNKRMYDGETDVTGADLAENADHVLTIWAEDDQGGKSTEITRQFRVIWNRPPVIDGQNTDLGNTLTLPEIEYSATDPEDNPITFTEYLNGKQLRSFAGTPGQKYALTLDHDTWIRLDLDTVHQLKVRATDSAGLYSERIYTFTRIETHIEFMLDLDNPNVLAHFQVDGKPERVLLTLDNYLPIGAAIESVKVCNNALDENPTWEDATGAVKGGRGHLFTNQTKTAEAWCINLWVTIAKGSATERVKLNGYGGAFD